MSTPSNFELIKNAFLFAAWGDSPDNQRRLVEIESEARQRSASLVRKVEQARSNGELACSLVAPMLAEFDAAGVKAARAWIEQQCTGQDESIARHLRIELDKKLAWQQTLATRSRKTAAKPSALPAVQLEDGHHPNSLHRLLPSHSWRIFIDESGSKFVHQQADTSSATQPKDIHAGRLVALAVPAGVKLPALKAGFHAVEEDSTTVDEALATVLRSKVGVFGFGIADSSSRHHYWLGQVHHLIRWVLLQLPLSPLPQIAPSVEVIIEQRGGFTPADDLGVMAEALESEFRGLDPDRFTDFKLKLRFMDSSEPLNGYVDAIAYTWGSPAQASRERLKKTALAGHCLVEENSDAAHDNLYHLYLALSSQRPLRSDSWYALCSAASRDAATGFLRRSLAQFGERCTVRQWQNCLNEVEHRLQHKDYHLDELAHALTWLSEYSPDGQPLSEPLRLMLLSARLASANHRGQVDAALLGECLELLLRLRDELPVHTCETLLRLASGTTNAFEFDALEEPLREWLNQPLGVGGLANHAKLHSTLGQLHAFRSEHSAAEAEFEQALNLFARLSDPAEREREQQQTRHYELINRLSALLAAGSSESAATLELVEALRRHCGRGTKNSPRDNAALSRSLAYSGQNRRYAHHLWLRALISLPQELADARTAYLEQRHQWQHGSDHPWPLIIAWRGWLLHDGSQHIAAREHFHLAIELCSASGPTLQWIAEVLRTFASSLQPGMENTCQPSAAERERLADLLPLAPHQALTDFAANSATDRSVLLRHLAACLPFNFH